MRLRDIKYFVESIQDLKKTTINRHKKILNF